MQLDDTRLVVSEVAGVTQVAFKDRNILEESAIAQLNEEISRLIGATPNPKLMLTFRTVEHMSSAALGMLIDLHNRVRAKGGQFRLAAIRPDVLEVFKITGLNKMFSIHPDEDQAMGSFRK